MVLFTYGATKKAISFLLPKWIQRQIETRPTFVEPFRALWETEREKERPPFNTAHMNGDDGGMTLGKALSKHYTTNTTWYSYRQQALKFIMSTRVAGSSPQSTLRQNIKYSAKPTRTHTRADGRGE